MPVIDRPINEHCDQEMAYQVLRVAPLLPQVAQLLPHVQGEAAVKCSKPDFITAHSNDLKMIVSGSAKHAGRLIDQQNMPGD